MWYMIYDSRKFNRALLSHGMTSAALVTRASTCRLLRLRFLCEIRSPRSKSARAFRDIITEEQVVRLRGEPAVLKQPQEVIILPMNIACGWMDGWMCICGCVGVCVCVCRWMRLCVQIGWLFLHLHPYTHTHTDIHTHRKSLLAPRALARWAETWTLPSTLSKSA